MLGLHPGAEFEACLVGTKGILILPGFRFSFMGIRNVVPEAENVAAFNLSTSTDKTNV